MTNQSVIKKYQSLFTIALIVLLAVLVGLFIASERLEAFEATATLQVAEQKNVLNTIAETIARNGADSVTESIIKDCPVDERLRFDSLLGQLDGGLSQAELRELDLLFSSCASFFADRKALMVTRFAREVEGFEAQVQLLDTLTTTNEMDNYQVATWQELLNQEQTQSQKFADLVEAQAAIITALISGESAASPAVVAILTGVTETRDELVFWRTKAAETRATLTTL